MLGQLPNSRVDGGKPSGGLGRDLLSEKALAAHWDNEWARAHLPGDGTRVVRIFPNEAACLRLVSAILMEISEDWETGKVYLTLDND